MPGARKQSLTSHWCSHAALPQLLPPPYTVAMLLGDHILNNDSRWGRHPPAGVARHPRTEGPPRRAAAYHHGACDAATLAGERDDLAAETEGLQRGKATSEQRAAALTAETEKLVS